jgi:hypothetical protein
MTFEEMLDTLYEITTRPDLVAESTSALRSATLKAHTSDFYSRDLTEQELAFEEPAYIQCMDLYTVFCNYRALKYIRRFDKNDDNFGKGPSTGGKDTYYHGHGQHNQFFEIVTPDELLDSYHRERVNIGYMAGRNLNLRANVEFTYALMGAYMFPIVTPTDKYSSWIAQLHPYAIINEAARVIFKMIGYDEQSVQYNTLVAEEYALLRMTGLADVGS